MVKKINGAATAPLESPELYFISTLPPMKAFSELLISLLTNSLECQERNRLDNMQFGGVGYA